MAYQSGTTSGTRDYHDLLNKAVDFACSSHIASALINAAGTGYTVGDVLTITHASAHLAATLEVLTVGGGGQVSTFAIRNAGAFAAQVVSATVSAGGTGYTNGSILQVEGGTWTNRVKFTATVTAGAVTSVALFEGGGSYAAFPSNPAATTVVGPSGVAGSGCTLTLTTQALLSTTAVAPTGGTGTGATFDLTLAATGMTAVRNLNNVSTNSVLDEREVVLQGTVAGGAPPIFGLRTYTQGAGVSTNYGWILFGMDSFNDGLATTAQSNVGPLLTPGTGGSNLLTFNVSEAFWFNVTGRRMIVVRKAQGGALLTYQSLYAGLGNPFGSTTAYPYPMYLSASTHVSNRPPDAGSNIVTGLTELYSDSATQSPAWFRHPGTGVWTNVRNAGANVSNDQVNLYPLGETQHATSGPDQIEANGSFRFFADLALTSGGVPSAVLWPTIGDGEPLLFPCVVKQTPNSASALNDSDTAPRLELDHVFWLSARRADGGVMVAEDTVTDQDGNRYRVFPNVGRTQLYSYFALRES